MSRERCTRCGSVVSTTSDPNPNEGVFISFGDLDLLEYLINNSEEPKETIRLRFGLLKTKELSTREAVLCDDCLETPEPSPGLLLRYIHHVGPHEGVGDWLFRRRLKRWQKWQEMAPATVDWFDVGAAVMRDSAMKPMDAYQCLLDGCAVGMSPAYAQAAISQAFGHRRRI